MSTDDFAEQARAEAERIFPTSLHLGKFDGLMSDADIDRRLLIQRQAFELGTEWARDHYAAQEPTDTEVEAAALSILADEGGFDLSDEDDAFHIHEIQWKDMDEDEQGGRLAIARAALTAARAAGRDAR